MQIQLIYLIIWLKKLSKICGNDPFEDYSETTSSEDDNEYEDE